MFAGKFKFKIEKKEKEIYKRIVNLTLPSFFELFLSSLLSVIDLVMLGRLSPAAISGVGLTNQPFFLLIAMFAAVNVGTTALVSWSIGSGDREKASDVLTQTIIVNTLIGALMTAIGVIFAGFFMRHMSDDAEVVNYATSYFEIICYGLMFQAVSMGISAALRGSGLTRMPMLYNIAANILKVILNYILIYGHLGFSAMGVEGAAISTTISRIVACAAALSVVIFYKRSTIRLSFKKMWRIDKKIVQDMFSIGLPAAGEQLVIQSGLVIFSRIVSTLGVNAFAAHQICANINGLAFSVSQAFSISTTSLVGQAAGANDYDKAEQYTVLSRRAARFATFIIAISFVFLGRYIAMLYTDVPEVIELCIPVFYFIAIIQFMQSSQMSTAGALRGSGDTMYPLYASIVGIWVFRVVVSMIFVLVFQWGLTGAWLSFFLDQCMRSFVVKRRFSSGKWKEMKAIKEAKNKQRELKRELKNKK